MTAPRLDVLALTVGGLRLASGISFLTAPEAANRLWGDKEEPTPTTSVLLRSMGYRDALIGALLVTSSLRGKGSRRWLLVSAGADAADLMGGWAVHDQLTWSQKAKGLGGAGIGIAIGLWGATRRRRSGKAELPSDLSS